MSVIELTPDEITFLESLAKEPESTAISRWAQVILQYEQGDPTHVVAEKVGLSRSRTRYIKQVFLENRLDLFDRSSAGQALDTTGEESDQVAEPADTGMSAGEKQPSVHSTETAATAAAEPEAQTVTLAELTEAGDRQAGEYAARQAQILFDATRTVHGLDENTRQLLVAAAALHRLKARPKNSQAQINRQPIADFSGSEQQLLATLVRYQREQNKPPSFPKQALADTPRPGAEQLLGLLRIAVALDSSHSQSTELAVVESTPDSLHLQVSGPHALTDATASQSASSLWSQQTGQVVHVYTDAGLDLEAVRQTAASLKGPGLHPDDSMAEAGRKVLRYHFFQMLVHEPGTRSGEDIEELHDMRVATRRMRAAYEVFGPYFQPKRLKSLLKGLRATGRALGKVRDLDVFIEKAQRYQESRAEQHVDLNPLLSIWSKDRESAREEMLRYLDSGKYRNFVHEMNDFVNTPGAGATTFDPLDPRPNRVREVAPMLIYTRLAEVRAYDRLLENASFEQLHSLRIDFKYLRYTVEFFREVLGPESKAVIDMIKYVQDHLGDLNDANVACQMLQEFLDGWETRQLATPLSARENPQPIVHYLAYQADERHRLLVGFPGVWQQFNQIDFLRDLALSVSVL